MSTKFVISKNTAVQTDFSNEVLRNAVSILERDIDKTVTGNGPKNLITLILNGDGNGSSDEYTVKLIDSEHVEVTADTALGVMYGALAISRNVLGIDNFWFWLDTRTAKHDTIEWSDFDSLKMQNYHVKYRGWFVNDELLFNNWEYRESNEYVWKLIFETLLRCGGNVVIPGTDKNAHSNRKLAAAMGLTIAHHHAEPLGADMFSRVYPDLEASYLKHPDLFKKIWQESIDRQKGTNTIFNIGFRGQGDRPFWADEDREYTLQDKADVINSVIKLQYDMVKKAVPDAICSTNIYGETTAIYNAGLLKLPKDVIQIWADNGYGTMVSRRQGNDDPRSEVLSAKDDAISQGIYYHVAFHDLQASNFLTLLQIDPHYVANQLTEVRKAGMDDLVMCNTGSIKPHIFYIWLVAQSWREDFKLKSNEEILAEYVDHFYGSHQQEIADAYLKYFETTFNYRDIEDQKAGDEFYEYTLRKLIRTWLNHEDKLPEMEWVTGDKKLGDQLAMISNMIKPHIAPFAKLDTDAQILMKQLPEDDRGRFFNDIWLSIAIHSYSIKTLQLTIDAFDEFSDGDSLISFLSLSDAIDSLRVIVNAWDHNPTEKWAHIYDNDCYTNITLAIDALKTLRNYVRIIGDGPDEDQWERQYLMLPSDGKVMLLSNTHKAYSDDEMALRLKGDKDY